MTDFVKNKNIYVPEQAWGVCIWILPNGKPLMDEDENVLSAEGFVRDKKIEKMVAEAARYWTGSDEGYTAWIGGARKISDGEYDEQQERLAAGYEPDPMQDTVEQLARRELARKRR